MNINVSLVNSIAWGVAMKIGKRCGLQVQPGMFHRVKHLDLTLGRPMLAVNIFENSAIWIALF